MSAHVVPRRGRRPALLAAAAVTLSAVAASTMAVNAQAHAETNRRICVYSFKAKPRKYDNPLVSISLGINYKKDGACPYADPAKLAASGFVDVDEVRPNPVKKLTCEEWGATHQTSLTPLGADPCEHMPADRLFAFFWQDPTTPNPNTPSYQELGMIWDYT